jgi:hypothetical protein
VVVRESVRAGNDRWFLALRIDRNAADGPILFRRKGPSIGFLELLVRFSATVFAH